MEYPKSQHSQLHRLPDRGHYDQETIFAILDSAIICHVAFVQDGQPYAIPTLYARQGNRIILHGAKASRMMKHVAAGEPVCITVTQVDGLVLARSVFSHSINYRSVMVFGAGRLVSDPDEKMQALYTLTEQIAPGRWADARLPNAKEMNATSVAVVEIHEASAKVRTGPPKDDAEDYALPVWAGVIPMQTIYGGPQPDPKLDPTIPLPEYLKDIS